MKKLLSALFIAAVPLPASAELFGVTAGVSVWDHQPSGHIRYVGTDNDLKNDMGLGQKTEVGVWADIRHPIPALPNIKIAYNQVSSHGDGTLTADFGSISASTPVTTDLTLDQIDAILYYNLLDTVAKVDLGLDIKMVDGNAKVVSSSLTENKDFNGPLPMLYLNAAVKLPLTGLSVGAQGSFIGYSGDHVSDLTFSASYESAIGLGGTLGFRREDLKVKDLSNVDVNTTIDGPFGAVFYHF